jgi:hypothetical protein
MGEKSEEGMRGETGELDREAGSGSGETKTK